jgi:hypothetical protein
MLDRDFWRARKEEGRGKVLIMSLLAIEYWNSDRSAADSIENGLMREGFDRSEPIGVFKNSMEDLVVFYQPAAMYIRANGEKYYGIFDGEE